MSTVVLCSNTPPYEIGAAALYHFLIKDSVVVQMSTVDSRSFEKTVSSIHKTGITKPCQLIVLGTYWNDCLTQLLNIFDTNCVLYCFGKFSGEHAVFGERCRVVEGVDGLGPAAFMFKMAKENVSSLCENNFTKVISLIDDRVFNQNIVDSQPFYTGMFNYDSDDVTLFDKFGKLFKEEYILEDVIKSGRLIAVSQVKMVRERVLKNSKRVNLSDGTRAAVSEGTELVSLTHDALHEKYPDAQITLILNMKFGSTALYS